MENQGYITPEEFRDLLAKSGLTQIDLATELGVEPSTVNRWCSPNTKNSAPVPKYPVAFLQLYMRVRELEGGPTGHPL